MKLILLYLIKYLYFIHICWILCCWSVTPSLHPLMSVTNAISSVIIVGAIVAALANNQITFLNCKHFFWIFGYNFSSGKYFWWFPCNPKNVSNV